MKFLKDKGIRAILTTAAIPLTIVLLILGLVQNGLAGNAKFGIDIIIPAALGVVAGIVVLFFNYDFVTVIDSLCYSAMFGFLVKGCAAVINDKINGIDFSGGNFTQALIYLIIGFIIAALCIVACFLPRTRKAK